MGRVGEQAGQVVSAPRVSGHDGQDATRLRLRQSRGQRAPGNGAAEGPVRIPPHHLRGQTGQRQQLVRYLGGVVYPSYEERHGE